MRPTFAIVACMLPALALGQGAAATDAGRRITACRSQASGLDGLQVSCPLAADGMARRFRFRASFSGGHDDTMASMTPMLGGTPLPCDEGSKTSLVGEDGDVSLECRFRMAHTPGTPPVLHVRLQWSHAQYTDFELVAE